jgi:type IV secretory pathway TraG/TraD family ATPase VirD4
MTEESRIYWAVGAIGAAALGALWLTGALSAAILGSGWTPIRLDQLLIAALRLPSHLGEPRAAWPRGVRAALPSAIGFYSVGAALLGALAALAVAARRLAARFGLASLLTGQPRRPPSARMAGARDLRVLRVPSPQPKRLTLGRHGGSLLAAEERQSVIVLAPTQTFKTTGFVIPALLEWEGPVLVTSVKNDLLTPTLARRKELGEVKIFDPTQVIKGEMPRSRVTPLWAATEWQGAMRVAHWLMAAARINNSTGLPNADFWFATAEKLLGPLLFAAASDGRPIGQVVRWLDEGPQASEKEVDELLEKAGVAEAQRAWQATLNREERQRSSVYTTAEIAMGAFADPRVIEETAGADYTPAMLLDGKANTLYLCAPRTEQGRLRPLFSMIVQELLAVVEELHAIKEKPLATPALGRGGEHRPGPRPRRGRLDRRRDGGAAALGVPGPRPGQRPLRAALGDDRQQPRRQGRRLGNLGPRDRRLLQPHDRRRRVQAAHADEREAGTWIDDRGNRLPRSGSTKRFAAGRARERPAPLQAPTTNKHPIAALVSRAHTEKAAPGIARGSEVRR